MKWERRWGNVLHFIARQKQSLYFIIHEIIINTLPKKTISAWRRQSRYGPVSLLMLNSNGLGFYFGSCRENQHVLSPSRSYTEMVRPLRLEAEWSDYTQGLALGQMDLELLSFLLTAVRKLFSVTQVLLTLLDPGCPQTFSTGYFHLVQEAEWASGSLALRQKRQAM